jgi:RHS repeat-associated protein
VAAFAYDVANQLTSLIYTSSGTTIGDLSYTYDAAGRRASISGSWARSGIPAALSSATYDAANRLTAWDGTSFSYDLNGNLTGDGVTSYTWNARNQLTGMSGGTSATFQYDGLRRRRSKTLGGTSKTFLWDGVNLVQELSGTTPTANLLTSTGIDETFTRADSAGTSTLLGDALGSALALTDAYGAVQTEYTYDPFGATTVSGTTSQNPHQFTGRENDGNGLYYYRARYYSSGLQRFASEDPIGFAGGLNAYAYVLDAPTTFTDPFGLATDFECWAKCIEKRRFTMPLPLIGEVPKRVVPPFRVPYPSQPTTTPLSVLAHFLQDLAPEAAADLRLLGRELSPFGTPLTLTEGFYDWYVIIECWRDCKNCR